MTTWCPELDGSAALLAELADYLHGDPRYTEPDVPAPRLATRWRDTTETITRHAAIETTEQDPS